MKNDIKKQKSIQKLVSSMSKPILIKRNILFDVYDIKKENE